MIPLICGVASGCPLVIEADSRWNDGSLGSAAYGSGGAIMIGSLSCGCRNVRLAVCQKMCQHLGSKPKRVHGYPFIHTVEQRGKIQLRRQPQRGKAETTNT